MQFNVMPRIIDTNLSPEVVADTGTGKRTRAGTVRDG